MVNAKLALPIDAETTRLRLSYSEAEIADYQETADMAAQAVARALGTEHGAQLARRRSLVVAAEAALDYAIARAVSGSNPGTAVVRIGQILRLDDSYVRVLDVDADHIEVERGALGSMPSSHEDGIEMRPVSPIGEITIEFLVDGAGSPVEAGEKGQVLIPVRGRLKRAALIADQAGSAVVDVARSAFADLPESGVSITGLNKPTLDSEASYDDPLLDGWAPDLEANDVLHVVVESASVIERLSLILTMGT